MPPGSLVEGPTTRRTTTVRVPPPSVRTTVAPPPIEPVDEILSPDDPITFPPNYNSFIRVEPGRVRSVDNQRVRFLFRTNEPKGLLVYAVVPNSAVYVAVELEDGLPWVDYDDGGVQTGPRVVNGATPTLNDGDWHELDIVSAGPGTNRIAVRIDGVEIVRIAVTSTTTFNPVYVGGLPEGSTDRLQRPITARKGFVGCIAVLIVNGRRFDLSQLTATSNVLKPGCVLSMLCYVMLSDFGFSACSCGFRKTQND